uniref:Uncharacterized protein n=1 Tax=Arundo donax TaxID=35708 RepID=A0A0A9GIL1_ARUDO
MLASTRRISLCIFCISGSTPDNDASVGNIWLMYSRALDLSIPPARSLPRAPAL